ncbi:hypothetical protein GALMADRAFT_922528 [Galerina marginata CBS 339.88]|uniref:Uncharacterized protein n=1 Tax=Galerina marginata (strain CBS 339.88) TaxID=685588 RepID=A0A067SEY8_GALM3|nr:hypothetical protein GALMADRAFT_922528 [Galerina marginata CBS 339.88]
MHVASSMELKHEIVEERGDELDIARHLSHFKISSCSRSFDCKLCLAYPTFCNDKVSPSRAASRLNTLLIRPICMCGQAADVVEATIASFPPSLLPQPCSRPARPTRRPTLLQKADLCFQNTPACTGASYNRWSSYMRIGTATGEFFVTFAGYMREQCKKGRCVCNGSGWDGQQDQCQQCQHQLLGKRAREPRRRRKGGRRIPIRIRIRLREVNNPRLSSPPLPSRP